MSEIEMKIDLICGWCNHKTQDIRIARNHWLNCKNRLIELRKMLGTVDYYKTRIKELKE